MGGNLPCSFLPVYERANDIQIMPSLEVNEDGKPPSPDALQFLEAVQAKAKSINPPVDFSRFQFFHDVFRHRAADPCQVPLMAFPQRGHDDYEYYTGKDLDRFTDSAAWKYAGHGLRTVSHRQTTQKAVMNRSTHSRESF